MPNHLTFDAPNRLIFDADDTLWENNVYFNRAIEEFLDLLTPVAPDRERLRTLLNVVEVECIQTGGYGTRNFVSALKETFCRIYQGPDGAAYLDGIEEIGERVLRHPIHLLPGVESTLQSLQQEYRLMIFSKGEMREQMGKIERSGLRRYFDRVVIAEEKDTNAYHELVREHELSTDHTWMIGNSPRSDVLPALAAGLWAVFVPHESTWELERHPVDDHPRLMRAAKVEEIPALLTRHGTGGLHNQMLADSG